MNKRLIPIFLILIGSLIYWLLPINGRVAYLPESVDGVQAYPRVTFETNEAGTIVTARDVTAYTHVLLESAETTHSPIDHGEQDETGLWVWRWLLPPDVSLDTLTLYHNCPTGCQQWTTLQTQPTVLDAPATNAPTKLGVVLANRDRDWHGRQGWDVEITYTQLAEEEFWGVDDLAHRVRIAHEKNLRVLVRVEYGQGQSIPPAENEVALDEYLRFLQRLTRDARLANVYGFIIGSNFNTAGGNSQAPEQIVSAEWYARVFNGYGIDPTLSNNAIEVARRENAQARIIVGPISPWNTDQNGAIVNEIDAPWLNYMNSLVHYINQSAVMKATQGIAGTAPDGFAVQAFGRVGELGALEPLERVSSAEFPNAQMGFRIYEDWLAIINHYEQTRGMPVYINATNTLDPLGGSVPAENYPAGWLTNAYAVVNAEPQIAALCWFIDGFEHDEQWAMFSLIEPRGALAVAASEFDTLLQETQK